MVDNEEAIDLLSLEMIPMLGISSFQMSKIDE